MHSYTDAFYVLHQKISLEEPLLQFMYRPKLYSEITYAERENKIVSLTDVHVTLLFICVSKPDTFSSKCGHLVWQWLQLTLHLFLFLVSSVCVNEHLIIILIIMMATHIIKQTITITKTVSVTTAQATPTIISVVYSLSTSGAG